MPLSPDVRSQIEGLIEQNKVMLFMKGNKHFPQCGFSAKVIKILTEVGAKFETFNVLSDPQIRDGIKEFSEWPTIPQLYVDKEFVGGCDIVMDMFSSGDLHKLLGGAAPAVEPPSITLTPSAAKAFAEAKEPGTTLRIEISADFQYELYFDKPEENDLVTTASDLEIRMSRATAKRAAGMRVDYVEVDGGGAFKIENPNEPPRVRVLRVEELKALLDAGEKLELIDVRTADEHAKAKIEGAKLFDQTVESELRALPKDAKIVFQCHHGGRSRAAAERMVSSGYRNVFNLEGGIDAWSQRVDPKVPRY